MPGAASRPARPLRPSGPLYCLSLGDSWAVGFQIGVSTEDETLHGYSNRVVADIARRQELILEDFGCNGAMTSDVLGVNGCTTGGVTLDAFPYPTTTQLQAAIAFIQAHPARIGLITISIGINDYSSGVPLTTITSNIATIVRRLRGVAGGQVPVIGPGMDDAFLADWLQGSATQQAARASVQAIEDDANPAIDAGYTRFGATFVNVGELFGIYVPLSTLVDNPVFGRTLFAVSQLCRFTSLCAKNDPHPTYTGYAIIAA